MIYSQRPEVKGKVHIDCHTVFNIDGNENNDNAESEPKNESKMRPYYEFFRVFCGCESEVGRERWRDIGSALFLVVVIFFVFMIPYGVFRLAIIGGHVPCLDIHSGSAVATKYCDPTYGNGGNLHDTAVRYALYFDGVFWGLAIILFFGYRFIKCCRSSYVKALAKKHEVESQMKGYVKPGVELDE